MVNLNYSTLLDFFFYSSLWPLPFAFADFADHVGVFSVKGKKRFMEDTHKIIPCLGHLNNVIELSFLFKFQQIDSVYVYPDLSFLSRPFLAFMMAMEVGRQRNLLQIICTITYLKGWPIAWDLQIRRMLLKLLS